MTTIISALFNLFVLLSSSLPGRVLAALGIGWLTYAGLATAVQSVVTATWSAWNSLPAAAYQLASLAGFTDSIGITAAALVARVSVAALPRLGKLS
ncbi:DUF2523 family protein [Methylomonas sp. DH-1]|uniref:DUF2523 family protein n=1 Tax=Methylomonas sp. (strain DH-1) TaxID=1727196 RepID=UPI0007C8A8D3|nr:DUF2523 family protein [Methylomonas sp. DH-1]ANE55664.1 hypothetical protein AYM39_11070 [Methylomonas sp. DH-1]ANE55674.1 hypothetical protein AYM39_11125 [Methylomonas sp. DH-1]